MHSVRIAIRASARRSVDRLKSSSLQNVQLSKHELSTLATVQWDPESSQFASQCSDTSIRSSNKTRNWNQRILQHGQIRFRRHDRSSAFTKPRPKTKKQRQKYNRRMKKLEEEKAKHSAPGSKAGPRRQWKRERIQDLLDYASGKELIDPSADDEYGLEDAIIEDIMGNTSHLTSQPTPEPVYLGHKHQEFFNTVAQQMDQYRASIDARKKQDHEVLDISSEVGLPSDQAIANLIRSYRDRHGTRHKPIGIVKALQHLLKNLGLPTASFGEFSYTALLTCSRTPKEARRIFKLMNDHQHDISAYSWSILVDIHAKLGDFEGCHAVMGEMASEGVPPTQAAFTSLLAACYKVCNDGRVPHAIRARAGKLGWRQWQEMRIIGIEPDAMAYGAIIRLCAARGQPERALNLLEDMQRFGVKPTTLCFSSALRAVARSHEITIRFERGSSRKQLRRESLAAHHGKMARSIVILAENAEVQLDDGFVSALMLCAAAAGDSATAKAVYLAAEVQKMDHLRTIGPDSSLMQLRGEAPIVRHENHDVSGLHLDEGATDPENVEPSASLVTTDRNAETQQTDRTGFGVVEPRESKSFAEREYGKDSRCLSALMRACAQAMNSNGIGTIWAGRENQGYLCENSLRLINTRWEPSYTDSSISGVDTTKVGIGSLQQYTEDERDERRKKGVRKKFRGLYLDEDAALTVDELDDAFKSDDEIVEDPEELSFQKENPFDRRNRSSDGSPSIAETELQTSKIENLEDDLTIQEFENTPDDPEVTEYSEEEVFEAFYSGLKDEAKESGEEFDLSEEDARELFSMMRDEFFDLEGAEPELPVDNIDNMIEKMQINEDSSIAEDDVDSIDIEKVMKEIELRVSEQAANYDDTFDPSDEEDLMTATTLDDGSALEAVESLQSSVSEAESDSTTQSGLDLFGLDPDEIGRIQSLQEALPGMPVNRLKKILGVFDSTLTTPSLVTLVPLLRQSMPDYMSSGWLKRMNNRNADFVLEKAKENGLVDTPLLNTMLQVKAAGSSIDAALAFYDDEYRNHNKKPTGYTDRLVLQMLISNKRLPRALALKERIESEGRSIDLPTYGSFVEYYARHGQLGSALMLLKESVSKYGAPPSEKYLVDLRLLCRQQDLSKQVRLVELIGEDPVEWLRHGEHNLKREMSKKGRRNVQLAQNRLIG